jgi:hypothetical protein
MTTPNTGVNDTSFSEDEAENSFLARWADAEQPSDTDEGDPDEDADLDDSDEDAIDLDLADEDENDEDTDEGDEADADQSDEDDDSDEAPEATDDHKVTVTVDGEAKTVSVKELKRLFGQEAALTRKSQEVAAARKVADTDGERYMVAAQRLMDKAETRFSPFAKIDWMVAQNKLSPDEFAALRSEAKDAYDDLTFLKSETDDVLTQVSAAKQVEIVETAKESIKVLERDIAGWNQDVYNQVRSFAVEQGMEGQMVNTILDPAALKIIHAAMKYSELKSRAAAKKQKSKKASSPKRVLKSTGRNSQSLGRKDKGSDAIARLKTSGSEDDAMAALMGGWSGDN